MAAAKEKRIAAVGLIATPGMTGADVVLAQQQRLLNRMKLTPEEKQAKVDAQKKIHEAVITGKGLEQLPPDVRRTVDNAEFQSLLTSDPAKLVASVRQPLLIVQGGARHAGRAAERRPPRGAGARAQERAAGRGRESAGRQPPARAGDHGRGR